MPTVLILACGIAFTSCDELEELVNSPVEVNAGTPQRTYDLDWKITDQERQFTCLKDLAGGKYQSDVKQIIFEYNSVGPDLVTPVRLTGSISMPVDVYNKEADARHLLQIIGAHAGFLTGLEEIITVLAEFSNIERSNIQYRLNSGRAQYVAAGGKLGRKEGYRKSDEEMREQYKNAIALLRKGYSVRAVAKLEGISHTTVQKLKNKFI